MNQNQLSTQNITVGIKFVISFITIVFLFIIYLLTQMYWIVFAILIYTFILVSIFLFEINLLNKKVALFTSEICRMLDDMMNGLDRPQINTEEETLLSRVYYRLLRLYEIMYDSRQCVITEKLALQELISDVSHQVKTPMSNLKILNETLLNKQLSMEKQNELLQAVDSQLNKMEFLMQSLVKTSRLEMGIISLKEKNSNIYKTLAGALGGIIFSAEKKNINVTVDCDTEVLVFHDEKWTTEALFNILDNAVKYTPFRGEIHISVQQLEMYTKIDVTDNGRGIKENHQALIFKRFYRDETDEDGIGIGLYLARKIISLQGGYIKVTSKFGKGSTFSIYLLNK